MFKGVLYVESVQKEQSFFFFLVREKLFLQPLRDGKGRWPLVNRFYFHFFNLNPFFVIIQSKLRRGSGKDPMWKRVWATFFDPLIYHVYSHMQPRTLSLNFSFSLFQLALLQFPLRQKTPSCPSSSKSALLFPHFTLLSTVQLHSFVYR